MQNELTEIACVIDRSGSMESIRSDAIGGFNAFLSGQQAHPGTARLSLVLFNEGYEVVHDCVPLSAVPPLTERSYVPQGTTALLDAVGRTVDGIGARLAKTPERDRPGKVVVAILTDGMENASSDYSASKVAEMIEHQRTHYGWDFIFLAANQDAITTASALSIDPADAHTFAATPDGVREVYAKMESSVRSIRDRRQRY